MRKVTETFNSEFVRFQVHVRLENYNYRKLEQNKVISKHVLLYFLQDFIYIAGLYIYMSGLFFNFNGAANRELLHLVSESMFEK